MIYIPREDVRSVRYTTKTDADAFALDCLHSELVQLSGQIITPFVRIWYDITNIARPWVVDVAIVLVAAH